MPDQEPLKVAGPKWLQFLVQRPIQTKTVRQKPPLQNPPFERLIEMKNIRTISLAAILLIAATTVFARRIAWKENERPPVSLEVALTLASAKVKERPGGDQFYCVGASIAKTFSEADWLFRFSSEGGSALYVNVASDKSLKISETGFEYY